ncbi:D-aminoacyl-tRNA deacylase [Desulfosarcina alkanivorans]|uniref:D-aminoacyl-tRNA deacylase n=1 Tax=Desulfosarcina alkanivorans TaxID=571177 RepID=A0A5K7YB62_9BACT|nr:D-aminoacyl-tRNA deacylase [Desulfosarcina alkanivorans]BBO66136.1 D-aminoacyl-tRNA deacylase [Desulfosarcina alkanivorans]
MIAVVQRVTSSSVSIDGSVAGAIGPGLNVLLGVADGDGEADADYLAAKVANLRIFEDDRGKMNRSLLDTGGQMIVISQFTLLGDCRKGRRPSFVHAAEPVLAQRLYRHFIDQVISLGVGVQTGRFGAEMQVSIVNDGPVTLLVHSR